MNQASRIDISILFMLNRKGFTYFSQKKETNTKLFNIASNFENSI